MFDIVLYALSLIASRLGFLHSERLCIKRGCRKFLSRSERVYIARVYEASVAFPLARFSMELIA